MPGRTGGGGCFQLRFADMEVIAAAFSWLGCRLDGESTQGQHRVASDLAMNPDPSRRGFIASAAAATALTGFPNVLRGQARQMALAGGAGEVYLDS